MSRLRISRFVAAALALTLVGCGGGDTPTKRTGPTVVVVYVDGVSGPDVAELWAEELGPGVVSGALVPVSTSLVAAYESAASGLEPPERGILCARDTTALHMSHSIQARDPRLSVQVDQVALATNVRALSQLNNRFKNSAVESRDPIDVLAKLRHGLDLENDARWGDGFWFESSIGTAILGGPEPRRPWPEGLADELAALDSAEGDPDPGELDAWFTRASLTRRGDEIEAAHARAWQRSLARELAGLAALMDERSEDWSVVLCGLRTQRLANGDVDLSDRLPIAVLSSRVVSLPTELRDVAWLVADLMGGEGDVPRREESEGVWRGSQLVGERGGWRSVEREAVQLVEPPIAGLRVRLGRDAQATGLTVHGSEDGDLLAATQGERVVLPERQGRRIELELEAKGEWVVHTRSRTTQLMLELQAAGSAVNPRFINVGGQDLGHVPLPRVIDDRGPRLDETELESRIAIVRGPGGELSLPATGRVTDVVLDELFGGTVHRWGPSGEPSHFTVVDGVARAPFTGRGRIAVVLHVDEDGDGSTDRIAESEDLALDSHASATDALRVLWPAFVQEDERPERSQAPSNGLRLDVIGPTIMFEGLDDATHTFLSTLRDHE